MTGGWSLRNGISSLVVLIVKSFGLLSILSIMIRRRVMMMNKKKEKKKKELMMMWMYDSRIWHKDCWRAKQRVRRRGRRRYDWNRLKYVKKTVDQKRIFDISATKTFTSHG